MAARVYATADEFRASDFVSDGLTVSDDDATVLRLLSRASRIIDRVLALRAFYDVDSDTGMPTDADLVTACRDATCAQAAWWLETGDEAGAAAALKSAGSGGGPYWGGEVQRLAPDAETVLVSATDTNGCPLLAGPWQQ